MKKTILILFVFSTLTNFAQIQKDNKSALTIEKIMQSPDKWIGTSPDGIIWDEQGKSIYFNWNPEQDTLASLYSYSLKEEKIDKVSLKEKQKLQGRYGNYTSDKTKKVFTRNGNLFLFNTLHPQLNC